MAHCALVLNQLGTGQSDYFAHARWFSGSQLLIGRTCWKQLLVPSNWSSGRVQSWLRPDGRQYVPLSQLSYP